MSFIGLAEMRRKIALFKANNEPISRQLGGQSAFTEIQKRDKSNTPIKVRDKMLSGEALVNENILLGVTKSNVNCLSKLTMAQKSGETSSSAYSSSRLNGQV